MQREKSYSPLDSRLDANRRYRLSRHVQLRPEGGGFLAESLITGRRELLPNPASIRLLLSLAAPVRLGVLLDTVGETARPKLLSFLGRCLESGLITAVSDDGTAKEDQLDSTRHWEHHDLLFHLRSRRGRTASPVGATWHLAGTLPREPARRSAHATRLGSIALPRPDLPRLRNSDRSLTDVLEERRSRYSVKPVSMRSLAELLFRACRITGSRNAQDGDQILRRVYPSGGGLHSLEVYVVAYRCNGLESGGYHYDAFDHQLEWLKRIDSGLIELLQEAQVGTGQLKGLPPVLLVFASRLRRVARKYQSLAYRLVLHEVGALYQTLYLVAEALELSVCAIGAGDSQRFADVFDVDFFGESSVGEMIVGGR